MSPQQYTRNKQEKHRRVRETKGLTQADRDTQKQAERQAGRQHRQTGQTHRHIGRQTDAQNREK